MNAGERRVHQPHNESSGNGSVTQEGFSLAGILVRKRFEECPALALRACCQSALQRDNRNPVTHALYTSCVFDILASYRTGALRGQAHSNSQPQRGFTG